MKKEILVYEGKRSLFCIFGAFLYAAGINLFVVPAGLYTGGVMGLCQVIRTILTSVVGLDFGSFDVAGLIYYLLNVTIFIIAFTRIGRKIFAKKLVTVTAM